jgi:VCBS repeat-containing protein
VLYLSDGTTPVVAGTPITAAQAASLIFTPAANFNGTVTIAFTVTDNDGGTSAPANEVITVTPVNDAPTAVANSYTTSEDTSVSGNVLTDDTGAGADSDIDGDSITAVAGTFATAQGGTVTLAANGTFTYTPAANFNGSDSFSYTITDGTLTSTATVTLTVTDVNDLPTATASTSSGNEDTDIAVALGGTDIDGTVATVTVTSLPPASQGVLYLADGTTQVAAGTPITAAQAASLIFTPAANFNGTVTIAFTVTDNDGGTSAPANEVITVTAVNDAPTAVANTYTTAEDTAVSGNVLTDDTGAGTDSDIDGDALAVVPLTNAVGGAGGRFTIAANGTLTFDPGADFQDLAVGETRTTWRTYTITDGNGGLDTAVVFVTVTGANDAPNVVGVPFQSIAGQDGTAFSTSVAGRFTDPDTSDTLTYAATGLPPGLAINPVSGQITGTLTGDASQGGPSGDGVYPITVTAADGQGGTASMVLQLVVANPAPEATDNSYVVSAAGDAGVLGNVLSDGVDDSDPDGDALQVVPRTAIAGTAGGMFTVSANGTLVFDPAGDFDDLAPGESRVTTMIYRVSDGQGGTDTAMIRVTVTGVAAAPSPIESPAPSEPIQPVEPLAFRFEIVDGDETLTVGEVATAGDGADGDGVGVRGVVLDTVNGLGKLGYDTPIGVSQIVLGTVNGVAGLGGLGALNSDTSDVVGVATEIREPERLRELAAGADRIFTHDAGFWDIQALKGFSLVSSIEDGASATAQLGRIKLDTLMRDRVIFVELLTETDMGTLGNVQSVSVSQADGRALPGWINRAENNLLIVEPPPEQADVGLEIVVTLESGATVSHRVAINLSDGNVREMAEPEQPNNRLGTFQQQVDEAANGAANEVRALSRGNGR